MDIRQNTDTTESEIVPVQIRHGRIQDGVFNRNTYFIENSIDFRRGAQSRTGLNLALWSWMSALIDGLILTSISCFNLVLFSFLMKTPAREIVKIISVESNLIEMFAVSFIFSFWVYMITMRVFMGASLGEWTCQLRLGQPVQRIKPTYVLRVSLRTSLLLLTGLVLFPILSLIFKRDLLGDITGVRIYSLT